MTVFHRVKELLERLRSRVRVPDSARHPGRRASDIANARRLDLALGQLPAILWTTDRDLTITSSLGAGLAALHLKPNQTVGATIYDFLETRDPAYPPLAAHLAALDGRATSYEQEWRNRHYSVRIEPFADATGASLGTIGVAMDVTERRLAEEALDHLLREEQAARRAAEQAEQRAAFLSDASRFLQSSLDYRTAFAGVASIAVPYLADFCMFNMLDEDGRMSRVAVAHNDPAKAGLARRIERFRLDASAPEGAPRVLRTGKPIIYTNVLERIKNPSPDEWPPVGSRDPDYLQTLIELGLRSYMTVPLQGRGRTLGAITFAATTPEREYGRSELSLAEELSRRCTLAIDNAHLYAQAQDAIRVREEFLSIASHELRTPVTSLRLSIQNLLEMAEVGSPHSESAVTSLQVAERQSRRLARLVESLLDVSRIQAGRLDLERRPVDLVAIAREVIESLNEDARLQGSVITLDAPAPVTGAWDGHRLEQVMTNLIANAIKYGRGRPIGVCVDGDVEGARAAVVDQGIGIEPELQDAIFDRFERAVSSEHFGGMGLGLYIAKSIVEAHGGSIHVRSRPGEGSTFEVRLPQEVAP